ncbi:MAG: YbjN domain-containing protein [Sphingopyxis sp.]|uniref:YbjN domain-containing protein n=1 Tax=Sphingopyxis sp. TaxID=1908224 RepID=UPI002AB99840|nr:YbjN domain-containing protein [Sphingopyxis sp.]MDZ3830953.1 YbjN domain-containing protein [Sphingopyxis sp.]
MREGWRRRVLGLSLAAAITQSAYAERPARAAEAAQASTGQVHPEPHAIAEALKAADRPAEIKTDESGDRYIVSGYQDRKFLVYFFDCGEGVRATPCSAIQFYIGFTIGRPFPLERINAWSRDYRFGRAYVDGDGDAVLEMDVNFDGRPMSSDLFKDNIDIWLELMSRFDEYVFERANPRPSAKTPGTGKTD